MRVIRLPQIPRDVAELEAIVVEVGEDRENAEALLRTFLLLAVWYRASSVLYHSWLADDSLSMICEGRRYSWVPAPQIVEKYLVPAACGLSKPGWFARLRYWLLGRAGRNTLAGRLVLQNEEHRSEWCAVCWVADGIAGVEFHRLETAGIELKPEAEADVSADRPTTESVAQELWLVEVRR
jgi:hypothetical protein